MDWEKCYEHQPITATILWDFAIQTDRKIKSNRQDIVVKGYNRKTCQQLISYQSKNIIN